MTTGKTIALTRRTFVGKVMSLLFNMLSRFVIAFLPRSKRLLISWLQSLSAVNLESKKIKSLTVSIVSPSICHEMMGLNAKLLLVISFPNVSSYSVGCCFVLSVVSFAAKVMSVLFNTLSRFVIAFLPRSKHLSFRFIFFPF